jgi:hypothetical protein
MLDSVFSDLRSWSILLNPLHFLFGPYAIISKIIVNTLLKLLFYKNLTLSQVLASSFITGIMGWGLIIFNSLIDKGDTLFHRILPGMLNDMTTANLGLYTGDFYAIASVNQGCRWALNLNRAQFLTELREVKYMPRRDEEKWRHLPDRGFPWISLTCRQYGVIRRACVENPALLNRGITNPERLAEDARTKYGALFFRGDVSSTNSFAIRTGIGVGTNVFKAILAKERELENNP